MKKIISLFLCYLLSSIEYANCEGSNINIEDPISRQITSCIATIGQNRTLHLENRTTLVDLTNIGWYDITITERQKNTLQKTTKS